MDSLPDNSSTTPATREQIGHKRGQPPKYAEAMQNVATFRFPDDQWAWLGTRAGIRGDRSSVLRSLVAAAMFGAEEP